MLAIVLHSWPSSHILSKFHNYTITFNDEKLVFKWLKHSPIHLCLFIFKVPLCTFWNFWSKTLFLLSLCSVTQSYRKNHLTKIKCFFFFQIHVYDLWLTLILTLGRKLDSQVICTHLNHKIPLPFIHTLFSCYHICASDMAFLLRAALRDFVLVSLTS